MKHKIIILIIIILICSSNSYPQDYLSLKDAINISLENNNTYKISMEKVNESRFKIRESWGKLWPDFSTDVAYTRQWAEAGMNSIVDGQTDINFVKASISVNPGEFYNNLKANYDGNVIAVNEVRRVKAETVTGTIKLYYRMLLSKEIIKLREDSLKALEESLKVVTTGYKIGTYTRLDFLKAKVATANENTKLINARNDYMKASSALNIQLGREIDSPLEPDPKAIMPGPDKDIDYYIKLPDDDRKKLLNTMILGSLRNRPELIEINYKKEAEIHTAKAKESAYLWPTLFANGGYGMSELYLNDKSKLQPMPGSTDPALEPALQEMINTFTPPGWQKNWHVTVGASYKWGALMPYDISHSGGNIQRSKAKQTDLATSDFIREVQLDIQQGLLNLISSSNAILSQRENIESAEEALRVALVQFRKGYIDNTKLLESNVDLSTAKTLYVQSLYDYQVSKAELNRAVGSDYFQF